MDKETENPRQQLDLHKNQILAPSPEVNTPMQVEKPPIYNQSYSKHLGKHSLQQRKTLVWANKEEKKKTLFDALKSTKQKIKILDIYVIRNLKGS
jgi:hypothetical protein